MPLVISGVGPANVDITRLPGNDETGTEAHPHFGGPGFLFVTMHP